MLTNEQIESHAEQAAFISCTVLEMDCDFSITLINDPSVSEEGLLDTENHIISLNLAQLKPFPMNEEPKTEEEKKIDENYRHLLKVYYVVFYEMCSLYKEQAQEAFTLNRKMLNEGKAAAQSETEKATPGDGTDAHAFASYLINRYPFKLLMLRTSRRLVRTAK